MLLHLNFLILLNLSMTLYLYVVFHQMFEWPASSKVTILYILFVLNSLERNLRNWKDCIQKTVILLHTEKS